MKLTKFQHACLVLEKANSTIIIDPGNYSHDFIIPRHVDTIIITHEHPDHFDEDLVSRILSANPKATIIAHENICGRFNNHPTIAIKTDQDFVAGSFNLRFFGGLHAPIAESIPVPPNYGVLVDNHLYYPGDSFVVPENIAVSELALPVSAPWLKISEAMNFLSLVKPKFAFPTHDAILTADGKAVVDRIIGAVASSQNTHYTRLDGQSIEISES